MSPERLTSLMKRFKTRTSRSSEAGVSAILTAIVATTLLGSVSFAVDMGNAMQVQRRAQNAADAASFAGLERYQGKLSEGATMDQAKAEAVVEAQRYANKNFTNIKWETCSTTKPTGFKDLSELITPASARTAFLVAQGLTANDWSPCVSIGPNAQNAMQLQVVIPNVVKTYFAGVLGNSAMNAGGKATYEVLAPPPPATGSLSGRVIDEVGNPIAQTSIRLTGGAAPITFTTLADGLWRFDGLAAGTYTVAEVAQPTANGVAYLDGPDTAGTGASTPGGPGSPDNDTLAGIVLTAGQEGINYTFSERDPLASVSGYVRLLGSNDPIPGTAVSLAGTNGISKQTTTDINGEYLFKGLPAGTYTVTETQPLLPSNTIAYKSEPNALGTGFSTQATINGDSFVALGLGSATKAINYNFYESIPKASVSGSVYVVPFNGSANRPLGGVSVSLNGPGGLRTLLTTALGEYRFVGLDPGTYTLTEVQPTDILDGPERLGIGAATAGTVGANGTDIISGIRLTEGQDGIDYAFTEAYGPSSITGKVENKTNGAGISGVVITLTPQTGSSQVSTSANTTGIWSFVNLMPGNYTVTEGPVSGPYTDAEEVLGVGPTNRGTLAVNDAFTNVGFCTCGQAGTGYIFRETSAPSSLSGYVYAGSSPIAGAIVTLSGTATGTQTTDASGFYRFLGLASGTYTVTETPPTGIGPPPFAYVAAGNALAGTGAATPGSGGIRVISGIGFGSGNTAQNYNFPESVPGGSISGFVRLYGSGLGIGGVTVRLNTGATTVTNAATGAWSFTSLAAGTYAVTETQPYIAGITPAVLYGESTDVVGGSGSPLVPKGNASTKNVFAAINLGAGEIATNYIFNETVPAAEISGRVLLTGTTTGIAGVTVRLAGTTSNGGTFSQDKVTSATGAYEFDGVPPGTYSLTETPLAGYGPGAESLGTGAHPNGTVGVNTITGIGLNPGDDAENFNFTDSLTPSPSSIAGCVRKNAGATGISGITVNLSGTTTASATTGSNGCFLFSALPTGTYTLSIPAQPAGYIDGPETPGSAGGTAGPLNTDTISTIVLPTGTNATGYVFMDYEPISLSGRVYQTGTSTGISGVTITLSGAAGRTTLTDGSGNWSFGNLSPGTYTVTETQPSGWSDSADFLGTGATVQGSLADDRFTGISLAYGNAAISYWFTEAPVVVAPRCSMYVLRTDNGQGSATADFNGSGNFGFGTCLRVNGTVKVQNPNTVASPHIWSGSTIFCVATNGGCTSAQTGSSVLHPNQGVVPDPLRHLPDPPANGNVLAFDQAVQNSGNNTLNPGTYTGPYNSIGNGGTIYLRPGNYIFAADGQPFNIGGTLAMASGYAASEGVTLFFKGGGERLMIRNQGAMNLRAPSGGPYAKVLVYVERGQSSSQIGLRANRSTMTGTFYARDTQLRFDNDGAWTSTNLFVVGNLSNQNTNPTINADAGTNATLIP